ncbi:MAG: DUF6291 domain-containing protein [Bacteroides xylanisolvens]
MRESFIFYRSFYEAIKDLPRDIQGEIYTAIMEYSLYGKETDNLKPVARSIFTLIKPQIDVNNKRYDNGKKGGRPKSEVKPNKNQDETKEKPKGNQGITKAEPNKNYNKNDNYNLSLPNAHTREGAVSPDIFDKPLLECYEELKSNQVWADTLMMNTRSVGYSDFTLERFSNFLKKFFEKLQNEGESVKSPKDAMSHFARWLNIELEKQKEKSVKHGSKTKSTADIQSDSEAQKDYSTRF